MYRDGHIDDHQIAHRDLTPTQPEGSQLRDLTRQQDKANLARLFVLFDGREVEHLEEQDTTPPCHTQIFDLERGDSTAVEQAVVPVEGGKAMTRARNEFEELGHRENEVDDLRNEKQEHCFAEPP
jgi:hypothetical protein